MARRELWAHDKDNPFRPFIAALEIRSQDLLDLLRGPSDSRIKRAEAFLNAPLKHASSNTPHLPTRAEAIDTLTDKVRAEFGLAIDKASQTCREALRTPDGDKGDAKGPGQWDRFLRDTLVYYYDHFDDFDQISYPILYSTGVGEEADIIDAFRVSPEDAHSLFDERKENRPKLAGTMLGHFGALFEEQFRVNDILWGRLDGAERVIAALLPALPELRDQITKQAHRAIIVEEWMTEDKEDSTSAVIQSIVWDALDAWDDPERRVELFSQAAEMLTGKSSFRSKLESLLEGDDPVDIFKEEFKAKYDVRRQFDTDKTLDTAKRINRVVGDMILGYFPTHGKRSSKRRFALWLGRRLRVFTEAAIEPEGSTRNNQRWKLAASYLPSLLFFALVCLPAFLLLRSATNLWPALVFLVILVVTLPLSVVPLVLTAGYNLAWLKLKNELVARLKNPGATKD